MSVSHTGQGLYPIIRRVRRPLLPVEPVPAAPGATEQKPKASGLNHTEAQTEKPKDAGQAER